MTTTTTTTTALSARIHTRHSQGVDGPVQGDYWAAATVSPCPLLTVTAAAGWS